MSLTAIGAVGYAAEPPAGDVLVLAHGAGAGQRHPFMAAVASGLAARGIDVVTFDFPYVREGRKVPDRAPVLEQAFAEALAAARKWSRAARLFIGGKSMGGRIATHLGASGVDSLRGIVVFGYPLHPPGKPEQLRVHHLPAVAVPVFIVQGERDAFGTPAELERELKAMTSPHEVRVVPRGDHSLSVAGRTRDEILSEVLDAVGTWMRRQP